MPRLLIALVLFALAPLVCAQVYKWTDAGGTVHYSQDKPAQGIKYAEVKTSGTVDAPSPVAPPGDSVEDGAGSHAHAAPSPAPVADTPENRSKLCNSLKSNLTALQGSGPVVMQQDGKPSVLGAEQRKQQIDTAQAQYNQYCQSGQ